MTTEILETLIALEVELHEPETRADPARLDRLLHPEFTEIGRSGRHYSRSEILAEFSADAPFPDVHAEDFEAKPIGDRVVLLTYRSAHRSESDALNRWSLRSSIWVLGDSGWQMVFHQGTPADA